MSSATLIYVDLPYACFGLEAHEGVVVDAAPIARWAVGRPLEEVRRYFEKKGLRQWIEKGVSRA